MNRTVVAPLSSAIISLMLAGAIVVGIDQIGDSALRDGEVRLNSKGLSLVEVSIGGGDWVRAARTRVLRPSDRVRVVAGEANLDILNGKAEADLRQGSAIAVPALGGPDLILEQGQLLVQSKDSEVEVDGGVALASVTGSAKLRRSESLAAGVYAGNTYLTTGDGSQIGIPQYRQAAAAGTGVLPADVDPLGLDAADAWDQRMLGEVIELDQKLEVFGRQFEAAIPAASGKDPVLFGQVIPELASAPLAAILNGDRAPGENVIGLTLVALDGGERDFNGSVRSIFGFRARGARWGLVAADRNLNPNPVLGGVEEALGNLGVALAPPGSFGGSLGSTGGSGRGNQVAGPGPGSGPGGTGPSGVPGSPVNPPDGGGPGGTTGPGPGTPPGTQPSTPPPPSKPNKRVDVPPLGLGLDPLLDPLLNPLEDLLSGLLDGLLGPSEGTGTGPAPTSTPATTVTTTAPVPAATTTTTAPAGGVIGGLLGGVTNTVGGLLK